MNDPAAMLLSQGTQLNTIGRYDAAVPLLSKAIAAQPEAAEPHCELAFALLHLGRANDALKEVGVAASLDPQYERPHRLRSIILNELGLHKESVGAAETAVRLAPDLPEALYVLGSAQLRAKHVDAAGRTADNLVRIAPALAFSHLLAGQVAIRRKQWKKAEDANRRALQIEPTQQVALNNLGVALQGQRRTKEALEIYQRAAQLNPNDPIAKGNIVRLVRPVSGLGVVLDVVRMVAIPWTIPIILIRLTVQFIASARRRSQLRAGAQLYYDREWLGSRWQLWRVLVAALVFALGYAALGILQLRGWSLVSTGIPVLVLLLVCIGIAFSAILGRLPAEIGRRWRALRPSGHDK